jgi:uncharacterized protein (TIGR03083 family)
VLIGIADISSVAVAGRMTSVAVPSSPAVAPSEDERGLASWEPADIAALVLPAWDEFVAIADDVDLDAPSRLPGWTARDVCVHLGSWPGSRSLERMRAEAGRGDVDVADPRAGTFDQTSHNEAVLDARAGAPRAEVMAALAESRNAVASYLGSAEPGELGHRPVRSVLGPLPLSTVVGAGAYELAVHALDLAPAGARPPSPVLLSAGLASLVDTTGALAARCEISATAACVSPEGGWAFSAAPGAWTTLELPAVPAGWPAVLGEAAHLLDASAGRRAVPPMLARRELRLHHVGGLLALAPIVDAVPGLPGGGALRVAVHNVRAVSRLVRRLPGLSR